MFHEFVVKDFKEMSDTVETHGTILAKNGVRWAVTIAVGLSAITLVGTLTAYVVQQVLSNVMTPITVNTISQQEVFDQNKVLVEGVQTIIQELKGANNESSSNSTTSNSK